MNPIVNTQRDSTQSGMDGAFVELGQRRPLAQGYLGQLLKC